MKPPLRGDRNLIKAMNQNLLLNIIRREGVLSRTQITEISGLSVGAVSQIINGLIENNWILETGEGDYTGGRRQIMIRLNPNVGYALGLKLMEKRVVCAITDFECRIIDYQDYPLDAEPSPEGICAALAHIIETTVARVGLERSLCLGIGIGTAGVVHSASGIVHYSPFFGWSDAPLAELLAQKLHLPVYVENDVNTLTLSEHLFGVGKHLNNFVVITIGRGIGMGMVIHGQLYQGSQGGAGELGHIVLDLPAARQNNNEHGTLEALASDPAIIEGMAENGAAPSLLDVVAAANAGDDAAQQALQRSGEYLGVGVATAINILSPNLVVISGEGVVAGDRRLEPMLDAIKCYTFKGILDDVEVIVKPTDDRDWARGAASVVISKVFASPLITT
jgi:predicted NBD/HSP70 family sugar kinase